MSNLNKTNNSQAGMTVGYAQTTVSPAQYSGQLTWSADFGRNSSSLTYDYYKDLWEDSFTFREQAQGRCGKLDCVKCYGYYDYQYWVTPEALRNIKKLYDEMNNQEKETKMAEKSISQELANLEKDEADRLLQEYGITCADGSLTDEGVKVLMRRLLKNERDGIVADLKKLDEQKKSRKQLKA